ncbi:DUF418 domain-containing protein [Nocardia sp. NPDC050406]|uniref:DUF418 domain-containing protein n=1 Tax=Nocardia sp. NPDC050406 TaxID=3364318 RepID=UPI0037AE4F9E
MSGPVLSSPRRIGEIDILRGFALFGILVTNVIVLTALLSFTGPNSEPTPVYDGTWDRLVYGLVFGLFLGKFYLLFAFLFGYSFTLQIAAAQRAGAAPVPRLLRRSGALFLIGLVHVTLLWLGDILTLYALLCLILLLLRKIRPRPALITGLVLYALFSLLAFIPGPDNDTGVAALGNFLDLQRMREQYTGGVADTFFAQIHVGPVFMLFTWLAQGLPSLAMFLIGMAAGKKRVMEDAELLRRWTPRALVVGFGVALPVSIVTVVGQVRGGALPSFWPGLQELVNPFLTVAYVAVVIWLTRSRWAGTVARLAPAGRMAASNYIFQSIVLMLVYTGYGLALADRVPPATVVAIALVTFAVQLWLSAWWLRRHPYGPVEWLLRAATYRQWPAWQRVPAPEPARA